MYVNNVNHSPTKPGGKKWNGGVGRREYIVLFSLCVLAHQFWLLFGNRPLDAQSENHNSVVRTDSNTNSHAQNAQQQLHHVQIFTPDPNLPLIPYRNDKSVPLLLAVGPSGTSTAEIFSLLQQSDEIAMARSDDIDDVDLFSWRFDRGFTLEHYANYIDSTTKNPGSVRYIAENSPSYFRHLLAPYRISTFLKTNAMLVFGFRQPVDAHIASYFDFHRQAAPIHLATGKNQPISAEGFLDWSMALTDKYEMQQACELQTATEVLSSNGGGTPQKRVVNGIEINSWIGNLEVERAIYHACYKQDDSLEGQLSGSIADYLYAPHLMRWHTLLPDNTLTCIFYENTLHNNYIPYTQRLASILGISLPSNLAITATTSSSTQEQSSSGTGTGRALKQQQQQQKHRKQLEIPTAETETKISKTVVAIQNLPSLGTNVPEIALPIYSELRGVVATANATVRTMVFQQLERVKGVYRGHYSFAQQFCRQHDRCLHMSYRQ